LTHEACGAVLCSHLIDPLSTSFQGLDWRVLWQSLQSAAWVKLVWDRAQAMELQRWGVPSVMHLPMAAANRPYDTRPLQASQCRPVVSFVGGQNTSYFSGNTNVPTGSLLAGVLAQSRWSDSQTPLFNDAYYDGYGLAEPLRPDDDLDSAISKVTSYFHAKLSYHAALCLRNRDRFVILLKRRLGDAFELIGRGWDSAYGLPCKPPIESADDYLQHFREVAININLVNGNAETGLNMRHFEITAAGGFMLCHAQPELGDCFQVGKECAVFSNEDELLARIDFYLHHPEERAAIAAAGQRRTLSQHLYSHRLARVLDVVARPATQVQFAQTTWSDDCRRLVPAADVVFDCGANVGQMATAFRRLYPTAEIYSFEPVAAVYDQLCVKCRDLHAHPVKKAVGDKDGRERIHLTASAEANSLLAYQENNPCAQWTWVVGEEEVEVCTLDRWCRETGLDPRRVDVIKLDVQGAELRALFGARKLLETVRLLLVEVSFVPIYKDCPLFPEVDRFLHECGYRRVAVYPSDQPQNWGDALYAKN
jgi:FkbM family methyltransferase